MRVLVHHRASVGFESTLRAATPHGVELTLVPEDEPARFVDELRSAHALFHVLEPLSRAHFEQAFELRFVQKIGVGVNTIDTAACADLGIGVANMPGTNTQAVAEHALALLLGALRCIPTLDHDTRHGRGFPANPRVLDAAGEVAGRTVGLVGFGAVAARLAPVLVALGATVVVATRNANAARGFPVLPLDDLIRTADVISLHVPLTPETSGLLDARRIGAMKRGAVLVNTSRGGLVDQPALVAALEEGRLRAAGLDVFAEEPPSASEPLLTLPNVVVTPHVAWRTPETLARSFSVAFANCARVMKGAPLLHEVVPVGRPPVPAAPIGPR